MTSSPKLLSYHNTKPVLALGTWKHYILSLTFLLATQCVASSLILGLLPLTNQFSFRGIGKTFTGTLLKKIRQTCLYHWDSRSVWLCFVDADHAGNKVTQRSHTGIMIFIQNAPILAFSKCQNTCESSSYGSELVAMCIARDLISAFCWC